jgi:phage/plasmid-like protein (TIGR03299 family)
MAHELATKNGKTSFAYVGDTPWHGLGQKLEANAPIDTWLVEAGMDYKIARSRVRFGEGAQQQTWDNQHVLFRSDTKAPLAVVSPGYKIVQPRQVLEFFSGLADSHGMTLETAGVLFGGGRYFALAKTGDSAKIAGVDPINGYLLLATSADGSMRTTAQFTTVRVVCNNTLQMSLGEAKNAIKISHRSEFDETQVKIDLGLAKSTWSQFCDTASELAEKRITKAQAVRILVSAMGDIEKFDTTSMKLGNTKAFEEQPNTTGMAKILALFDGKGRGADLVSAKGTAWGLVNATTEYLDHAFGRTQDSRLANAWFGPGANLKRDVVELALAA